MSTAAVSPGTGQSASSGTHASSKSSGTSGDKAGKAGASQAPKGDVFAMLLMMLGDGAALAPDAGTGPGEDDLLKADGVPTEDPQLALLSAGAVTPSATAPTGLGQTDTDPVQAMLASRYPLERRLDRAGISGPEPGANSTGNIDIAELGMQATTDSELPDGLTLPSDLRPAEPPATNRPAPGLSMQRQDMLSTKTIRLPAGTHAATSHIATRAMTEMSAQAAVTLASRSGEAMTWSGGLPMRSTVQLDARLSSQDASPLSVGDLDSVGTSGLVGGPQAQGSGQFGEPGQPMPGESGPMDLGKSDASDPDMEHFADAQAALDDEAAEHWHAGQLQQARLSIAGESGESIEVQLQLAGDSVNVEFRTDDENARQQLSQDGGRELSGRLEQEGLSLIDVSVGGRQGSGNPQGKPGNPSTVELGRTSPLRRGGEATDTSVPGSQGLRPRADPGRPLDLFV